MRLSPAQLATIEYQNDGKLDSLTSTLAPGHFFELVVRESSIAERAGASLLLLSIKLDINRYFDRIESIVDASVEAHDESAGEPERFSPTEAVARIERYVINLAETISENLRAGDLMTRYSDTGFLLLMRGSEVEFHLAQKRISEIVKASENLLIQTHGGRINKSALTSDSIWNIDSLIRERGEARSHLIERVDRMHFR